MKKHFKFALILFVSLGIFISCNIGLGETVDTEAPKGSILVPDPLSVTIIRDSFPISGTWSDDGVISSVNITLRSMDSNEVVFNENATVEKGSEGKSGTWNIVVNPFENSIKDNSYNVMVTIEDKSKHTTSLVSSIIIDNTAPVIVLSRPSTASDSATPDSYGQSFTLSGFAADDNNVASIDVNVFSDIEQTNLVHTVSLPNVANSIDREVAHYNEADAEDDYHKIYFGASTESDVTKTFYCSILSYDNAQRIPVDGTDQTDEDKKGNCTNIYYLNDSVSDLINSYKMTGLYKIKNGTYTKTERSVLVEVLNSLDSLAVTEGMFSLNPANNPKYTMADKYKVTLGEENFKDSSANILNGGSAVITVSPGLDGIAIDPDSLKVYAQLCDAYGTILNDTKIYPSNVSKEGVSEYTLVATFSKADGFKTGKNYLIGLEGQDLNGSKVKANFSGYAFHFASSDVAPIIKISSPEDATSYKKKGDSVEITGTVEFKDEGTFQILLNDQVIVSATGDNGVSQANLAEGKLSYLSSEDDDDLIYEYKYIIPASQFSQTDSALYSVSVTAFTDAKRSSVSKDIKYDVAGPNIAFSVNPIAKKYAVDSEGYAVNESSPDTAENGYLNGTFTMNLTIFDDDDKLSSEEDKKPKVTIKQNGRTFAAFSNISIPSNTARYAATAETFDTIANQLDDASVTFIIEAYDRAGNKTEQSYEYTVNQDTDYPVVFPTHTDELSLISKKTKNALLGQSESNLLNIFSVDKAPSLDFTFRDDDSGTANAEITLTQDDNSQNTYTENVEFIVQNGKGSFSFPLEPISATTGIYKASLVVTDSVNKARANPIEFYINLVPGAPEVSVSEFDANPYISLSSTASSLVPEQKTELESKIKINSPSLPFRITKRIELGSQVVLDYKSFADLSNSKIDSTNSNITNHDGIYYYSDKITDAELRALSLANGEYKVSYRIYDVNGLYNDTGAKSFIVDSSAPSVTGITYPTVDKYKYTPSSFTFEVSADNQGDAPVTYYFAITETGATEPERDDENTIFRKATSSNKYNLKYSSEDEYFKDVFTNQGEKKVWYYAEDAAGNRSPVKAQAFFFDETPPSGTISLSSGSKATSNTKVGFDISASDTLGIQKVELYENNVLKETYSETSISGSQSWSYSTGAIFPDDYVENIFKTYKYKVVITDLSGKQYETPEIEVKIDTQKPGMDFITLEESVLSGDAGSITGTASDTGSELQLLHYAITTTESEPTDSNEWKTVPQTTSKWSVTQNLKKGSGTSVTDTELFEGAHWLWVYVEDAAGNPSDIKKRKFFVDQAKPVVSTSANLVEGENTSAITSSGVKYLNVDKTTKSFTINGTVTESNGLKSVSAFIDNSTSGITGTFALAEGENSLYNYTISGITLPEDDSDIRITIKTKDLANQDSDDLVFTLHNDKTAPVISFIDPSSAIEYKADQSISKNPYTFRLGLSDSGAGLVSWKYAITNNSTVAESDWLSDNDISGKSASPSIPNYSLPESETEYYLHVKAKDVQNNETSDSIGFWVDYSAPSLTLSEISSTGQLVEGKPTCNTGFDLTVTASDSNKLKDVVISSPSFTSLTDNKKTLFANVKDSSATQSFNGSGEGNITLADGPHSITVTATDIAGRKTTQTVNVYVDRQAPDISSAKVEFTKVLEQGSNVVAIDGINWYNKPSVNVSVSDISDASSGIYQVAAAVGTINENTTWTTLSPDSTSWKGSIYCPEQGANSVTFRVTDNAGNEQTISRTVYIDTEAPDSASVTAVSIADVIVSNLDETILINGTKKVVVKLSATDANYDETNPKCTGIATTIVLNKIGNKTGTITGVYNASEEKWIFTLPANSTIFDTGNMQFTITDKVGNSWNYTSDVSFDFDNKYPSVSIDAITDADKQTSDKIDVNNIIKITGKASDNNHLSNVRLQYKLSGGDWQNYGSPITEDLDSWSIEVDTSTFEDNSSVELRAVGTDSAQNEGNSGALTSTGNQYSNSLNKTVYVNQASDIPEITFTSFELEGMKSESGLAKSQSQTLRGTVSDDDGLIQKLEYTTDGTNWEEASLSGVTFALELEDNTYRGDSRVRFRVTDKAGTEFTSAVIKDKNGLDYTSVADSAINIIVDSIEPEVIDVGIKPMYGTSYSPESFSTTFGGDSVHNQFMLQLYAYDVNNIASVKYKLDDGAEKGFTEDITAINGKYTAWNTSETVSVTGLASGQHTISIVVTDFGGSIKQILRTIYVDNDAPELVVTSPSESELNQIGSAFSLQGTIEDGDIGSTVYYQVTKKGEDADSWAQVKGASAISWKLYFDKEEPCEDSAGYTHYLLPKYIVAALNDDVEIVDGSAVYKSNNSEKYYGIIDGQLEQYDFHLCVKDSLGNTSYLTLPVKIDPQGDIPTIKLEYPEVESYAYYNASATPKWAFSQTNAGQTIVGDSNNGGATGVTYSYVGPSALWSGTIPVSGSASAVNTLTGLYMQIDPSFIPDLTKSDKGFAADWKDKTLPGSSTNQKVSDLYGSEFETFGTRNGIKLGTNLSWAKSINTQNEFELKNSSDTNYIAIRLFAYDNKDNTSVTDNEIFIVRVNTGAPKVGLSEPLQLVQYENNAAGSGNVTKRINYTNGMYLNGEWWLTGSVEDEDGVYSITIDGVDCKSTSEAVAAGTWTGTSGYRLNYKVGNSTPDAYGTLTYTLVAKDGGTNTNDSQRHTTTKTLTIKYDNKAPSLAETNDDYYSISTSVLNSNGFYSVQSAATEANGESGFLRTVVYFKRNVSGYKNVYDSFIKKGESGNELLWDGASKVVDGGDASNEYLYWKNVGTVSAIDTLAKTVTLSSSDVNIHKGGLIKLSGVIYKITAKEDKVLTLDDIPATTVGAAASVAIGHVIDHVGSETAGTLIGSEAEGYGYYTNSSDDDGDGMIESVSTVGTKTRWSGKINSLNIPDGLIEIHYVVFDKAGNVSHNSVTNAVVKNNVPRLASLKVWSDYNENEQEDDIESKTYYYSGKTRRIGGVDVKKSTDATETLIVAGTNNKAFMSVKGDVVFTPEIIGGNGALYYTHKMASTRDGLSSATASAGVRLTDGTNNLDGTDATIDDNYKAKDQNGQLYINNSKFAKITRAFADLGDDSTESSPTWFEYTIWDSTPGTTLYSNSLSAKFQVALRVIKTDEEAPKSVVNKFYWKSADDNSLYLNDKSKGHIDLEADWENGSGYREDSSLASNLRDRDPKVSGKITVRGSIYDNVLLDSVYLKIPDFSPIGSDYVKLASYDKGEWKLENNVSSVTMDANHWTFSITDEYNNSDGHKANWEFSWDTAYITGVAKADVKVYVQAEAARGGSEYQYSSETATTDNIPYYQMDVVPYITSLTTGLSSHKRTNPSIYDRTAKGHYPVRIVCNSTDTGVVTYNYEQFTIAGFNLSDDGTNLSETVSHTLTAASTSGNFEVTVSGVPSLNNYNYNDSQGTYGYLVSSIPAQGDADVYANFYNRQPNGDNNNNLTDDVVLDIWEFNPKAVQPKTGKLDQPIMKINPTNDKLGFAFADGPLNFNMGGKTNGNSGGSNNNTTDSSKEYAYHTWLSGYDVYTSIAYAYDVRGYSYGISAGGDINASDSSDRLSFFTGRWGNSNYNGQGGSKDANTKLRMETIGEKDDSNVIVQNKQRFYSPSIVTSTKGTTGTATNIYFAYYDAINNEIRFKAGTLDTTAKDAFGNFTDLKTSDTPTKYDASKVDVVVGGTKTTTNKNYGSGKYLCVGVDSSGTSDVAVLVWYDETNSKLWYAYNSTPLKDLSGKNTKAKNGSEWTISEVFTGTNYDKAGQYCQVAVDKNGGVHIAAYDPIGSDLVYAYSASSTSPNFTTCIVDGYAITGANISLDVGVTSDNKAIPYIGYYSSSCISPKYAYLPAGISSSDDVVDGAVSNAFTGAWECTVLPTSSTLEMNSKQYNHINVCSWKTTAGVLKAKAEINTTNNPGMKSTYSKAGTAFNSKATGQVYANGTANPILGYNIKDGASSNAVETAQMR